MTENSAEGVDGPTVRKNILPEVNVISPADIRDSLFAGMSDFVRAPTCGLIVGGFFAFSGLMVMLALTRWHQSWLIYPFAIGFPLLGPYAAVGLYEVSRRLETGQTINFGIVLRTMWAQRSREIVWMAFVMLFIFWIWMYQIRLLLAIFLGRLSFSTLDKFMTLVMTTQEGWLFLAVGHVIGAGLALVLFSVTVISMPMLLDRETDFITAMITSVKTVVASPVPMLGWGVIVTLAVLAACVPFFAGLLIVFPVLGHTTWHLYRKAVAPAA